jgi:hypothetical protein
MRKKKYTKTSHLEPALRFEALNKRFEDLNPDDFRCEYEQDTDVCNRVIPEAEID